MPSLLHGSKRRALGVIVVVLAIVATACGPGDLAIIAGTGPSGSAGDGAVAIGAQLNSPTATTKDTAGNLYIADTNNHRVRKVDTAGVITTIAGTGSSGFSGDGGAATSAQLSYPGGIAVDAAGNVYIADTVNSRIRKVTSAGTISTYAGGGFNIFGVGDGAAATKATLSYPTRLAFDGSGNLLIADSVNQRIRRVTADGKIATIAGTGTAGFSGDGSAATSAKLSYPAGIAVDSTGAVVVADTNNHRIRRFTIGGPITTIAGTGTAGFGGDGGAATSAQLNYPGGVAVDPAGNVILSDNTNNRVRRVATTGVITTIGGTGNAASTSAPAPKGPALKADLSPGSVWITPDGKTAYVTSGNVVYSIADPGTAPITVS